MTFDTLIVGGGPAGAACAVFCAKAGLKTALIERAVFPRDKVCGDCLNPSCWPVFGRLGVASQVLDLPHSKLTEVEFVSIGEKSLVFPLLATARGEIAVKRAHLDELLLQHAVECGAEVRQGCVVTTVERVHDRFWRVRAGEEIFTCRTLIAADGRNSSVARTLGLLPPAAKERVAVQTHIPAPTGFGERVVLRLLREGYCGIASIGGGELNLCLVARPPDLAALKVWAEAHFNIAADRQTWRTISPLARQAITPWAADREGLFFIGDAARVVEPFTGEGIYYALASAELAAEHICGNSPASAYVGAHARLYRNRLWVNQIAKIAVMHPRLGSAALRLLQHCPAMLRFLTGKVVGEAMR